MVVEGFGDIGRGDAKVFGKVIDRRSFSAAHAGVFNVEIMLKVRKNDEWPDSIE
jgi:hypothetical protein